MRHSATVESVNTGVAQGSKLSTLLFITLVHDLLAKLPGVGVQYADDVTLFFEGDTFEEAISQQLRAMDLIQEWCSANSMVLNESKSFYQFFSSKKNPPAPTAKPYGQQSTALKILGCHLEPAQEAQALKSKLEKLRHHSTAYATHACHPPTSGNST